MMDRQAKTPLLFVHLQKFRSHERSDGEIERDQYRFKTNRARDSLTGSRRQVPEVDQLDIRRRRIPYNLDRPILGVGKSYAEYIMPLQQLPEAAVQYRGIERVANLKDPCCVVNSTPRVLLIEKPEHALRERERKLASVANRQYLLDRK